MGRNAVMTGGTVIVEPEVLLRAIWRCSPGMSISPVPWAGLARSLRVVAVDKHGARQSRFAGDSAHDKHRRGGGVLWAAPHRATVAAPTSLVFAPYDWRRVLRHLAAAYRHPLHRAARQLTEETEAMLCAHPWGSLLTGLLVLLLAPLALLYSSPSPVWACRSQSFWAACISRHSFLSPSSAPSDACSHANPTGTCRTALAWGLLILTLLLVIPGGELFWPR